MHRVEVHHDLGALPLPQVRDLVEADAARIGERPIPDHVWLDLVEGGRTGAVGAVALDGDAVVGYAQLSPGNGSFTLAMAGERATDRAWVTDALVDALLREVGRAGGGVVHWVVVDDDQAHQHAAATRGLVRGRTLVQMRVALPLADDGGERLAVRPFVVGQDEAAWLDVNNTAFADHPEQGGWDLATLRQREQEPWFDPAGFLLHERDGRLAAFCWTKVHATTTPPLGEIYAIAVHPAFTGGLGKRIVRAGLAHLAGRGIATGMLYVDQANPAAMAMYERLGFRPHREDHVYVTTIAPA